MSIEALRRIRLMLMFPNCRLLLPRQQACQRQMPGLADSSMLVLYKHLTHWLSALACPLGEVCCYAHTRDPIRASCGEKLVSALAWSEAQLWQCPAGSMLATGMAVAVLLLVLEGVLDSSGWVLGLFSLSPGRLPTLEKKLA